MRLRVFLKVNKDCAEVTSRGESFQTRSAATSKTRSPIVFSLERRTTSLWLDADRKRFRESSSTAHCRSLAKYSGAVLLRQRNTRTARRNAIRSGMHAQPVQIAQQKVKYGRICGRCTSVLLPRYTLIRMCRLSLHANQIKSNQIKWRICSAWHTENQRPAVHYNNKI